jgi:hypothetical protein
LHARLLVPLGRASCHPHFNAGSNAPDCVVASKYFEGPDGLIRNARPKTASPNTLMCRPCSVIQRFDVVDRSVCLRRHELFSDFVENGVAWVCPIRERLLNVSRQYFTCDDCVLIRHRLRRVERRHAFKRFCVRAWRKPGIRRRPAAFQTIHPRMASLTC